MRLKKLEIKGFKSFAKPTTIHFSENVTGVVGPNGSGKSNVVDAIRWVLGEQRYKDLRLEKMSDVLFNGTKTRKRTGMAQVVITFENDNGLLPLEYNEVSISRHLYRSGQSEYRLNNVTCRLKDISSLLSNTGIGSNNYAIIELGMVDDILQDKNNARRRMFEQAAGIYAFKQRKHETTLKLKATNDDLERVQDLLHEIESNMKQLEKQARRARKYMKLKGTYKASSILLAANELSAFKDKYAQLKEQIQSNQADQTEIYGQINSQSATIECQKLGIQKSEGSLSQIQQSVRTVEHEIADLQSQIGILKNQIKYTQQDMAKEKNMAQSNEQRMLELQTKIEALNVEIESGLTNLNRKRGELDLVASQRDEMTAKMENVEIAKNEMLKRQRELNEHVTSLERILAVELNKQQSMDQVIKHTQDEISHQQNRLLELQETSEQLYGTLKAYATKEEELKGTLDRDQSAFNQLKEEIEETTTLLFEANRSRDAKQNEHDLLKNMIENLEGYPDSIKFLAKEHAWKRKASLLSEIIVCQDEYKNAIEAILEPYLNYYVVKGRDEAVAAITLLKDSQRGRASFFDANSYRGKTRSAWAQPNFVSALDVVEITEEYKGLIAYLLANVFIHSGNNSYQPINELPDDVCLVAKDGHRIESKTTMSGGSPGLFDGLKIGRKKNLEGLQKDLFLLADRIDSLAEQKLRLSNEQVKIDLFFIQNQLDAHRSEVAGLESESKNVKLRLDEMQQQIDTKQRRIREFTIQKKTSVKLSSETEIDLGELNTAYKLLINELSGESSIINRLSRELNELNTEFSNKNIAFVQVEGQVDNMKNETKLLFNRINELTTDVNQNLQKDELLSQKLEKDEQTLSTQTMTLMELLKKKQDSSEELSQSEQNYFSSKNQLMEAEKKLNELNRKNVDFQYLISALKDEYNEIKIKLNDVSQRVKVEFNINTQELLQIELTEEIDLTDLTEHVEKMRIKLYGFGEVNPLAVEAYNEMKERHEGITAQKQDIEDAQKSLLDTIIEMEDQATIQFLEALEQINDHFKNIFRSLFSEEDNCDLVLLDPENPLESSIEVVAKPKGKRPQSLSQLSGGEKTLTATALLFALYLLKPAPFCIFDEVDAPLDDANIQKFNNIIQNFSGDSQFVIITHNKLTMAAVDIIYGVYMDEPGVSGVTPVDFRELKHEMLPLELSEN